MIKRIILMVVVLSSIQYVYGQAEHIEVEKWGDNPVLHTLSPAYAKESAVVISDRTRVEYIDNDKKDVDEFYTLHKIVHINDDRGIEEYNKIYLGISENADIVDIKARTILPGGKIINLDKSNIKDIKEQDGNTYKIFAMEGLEKGCEIEFFYTFKRDPSYFGREIVQSPVPVMETLFQVIAPERLRFDFKPYNFMVAATDTVISNKRITQCTFKETPGYEDEKYAFNDANLYRIEYKLSYNDVARKGERLFTWNELAKRIYAMYTDYSDKEYKQVADMVTTNGWDKIADEKQKIITVENFVKSHFSYNEELKSDEGNRLDKVLRSKDAGTFGIMHLYTSIFQNLGINYQLVLTGNRLKYIIDRSFENWNNCDDPLFYFPAEKKFIAPTRPDYRYPLIFPSWGETNGLFCRRTTLGSFTSALGDVKPILLEDYSKSFDNIESKIELTKDLDSLNIDAKQLYGGYIAVNYRDAFNFSNDEQKRRLFKDMAKTTSNSENITFSEVSNKEFEDENTDQPLIVHIKTRSSELIERAGNKLLLKIGLAIGPQEEMYQEKPRQQPVDIEFGHIEERKIDFVIPDGYLIKNLEDLKINQTFEDEGALTMGFVSNYEIKGNMLSIHIMEEYHKTVYPLNQFDQFRRIINASSDFNKVVLVLEKKS